MRFTLYATATGLSGPYWLVHRLANEWLWVSSSDMPFHSGVVAIETECRTQENDIRLLSALLAQLNMRGAGEDGAPLPVYYSSVVKESLPENTRSWSPLTAFAHYQPPLPALPAAFTLAGGLAVRAADSLSAAGAGY